LFISYLIEFINMTAPSRRVRVSRIKHKRKILRLLPTIIVGSKKEYFSLLSLFGYIKPGYWARSNER